MLTDTIIFAFQNWNESYDWWQPNTVPVDFIINGKKTLPPTHGPFWFDNDFFVNASLDDLTDNKWFDYPAKKHELLYQYGRIEYKLLSNITNQKYLFPICMTSTSYFNKHISRSFDYVDDRVLTDVKNGIAKIVFLCPFDGFSGAEHSRWNFVALNDWCFKHGLTRHQVFYLHGNLKGPPYPEQLLFTYVPTDVWHGYIPSTYTSVIEYSPVDQHNIFLSYNRQPSLHRVYTICELIKSKLLDRGLVSFGGHGLHNYSDIVCESLAESANVLEKISPLILDVDTRSYNPLHGNVPIDTHYQRTLLSLVTETHIDNNTIFFSEKIYKPISVGHPFMVISSQGFLKKLKDYGYKTFDRWWDESYDDVADAHQRIQIIVEELNRLSKLSIDNLYKMRIEMKEVLEYNQNHFNNFRAQYNHQSGQLSADPIIYKEIENIWAALNIH